MDLHGLQLPHHGLRHGLQVNLLEQLFPLLLYWPWCLQSCLSYIFLLLYSWLLLHSNFFLFLESVTAEALPLLLMGSILASIRHALEPAGIGSVLHGKSFWQLLTEISSVDSPTTKVLPGKPNTVVHHGTTMCRMD